VLWGVGIDSSIVTASLKAIISAVNRAQRDQVG
jgi:2-isopropylmalate synthase